LALLKLTLTKARMIAATPTLLRVAGLFDLEADLLNAGNGSKAVPTRLRLACPVPGKGRTAAIGALRFKTAVSVDTRDATGQARYVAPARWLEELLGAFAFSEP
jgi:hypothetical protein